MAFILTAMRDGSGNALIDSNGNALVLATPVPPPPGPFIPVHKWWKKIPPFDPFTKMKGDDA